VKETNELPRLYGYDSKGKVKVWYVTTLEDTIRVHYGLLEGKITTKDTKALPKNVGRSNETTGAEQATLESVSKWNKQKDKNYHEDISNCVQLENPMLAHDYRKHGHRIEFPCYAQPKLDGVRCFITKCPQRGIIFKSRGNKEYPVIKDIVRLLNPVFVLRPDIILDGELYIHGESLQNIVSAVKKHKDLTAKVEFHLFDLYRRDIPDLTWQERDWMLQGIHSSHGLQGSKVKLVESTLIVGSPHVSVAHKVYTNEGYEGVMLRNQSGVYALNSRSADLQKYKEFLDSEFLCTGVKLDKDGHGVLQFEGFDAAWKGTHESRRLIADNPQEWIGKIITVQYQGLTDDWLPQFPVAVAIRDYE